MRPGSPRAGGWLRRRKGTRLAHMPRGLGSLLLLLVILSCTSGTIYDPGTVVPSLYRELEPSERAKAQRRSLRHVFYRNNAAPPAPTEAEYRKLHRDLAAAPELEVRELIELFGDDLELFVYATRDTDGDGVLDYRVSEYGGKFFEGDIDIDGDGIRNVYDADPYDPRVGGIDTTGDGIPDKPGSFADRDGDGIPDHLDWSRRKPEPLAAIQAALFRDFGVILVERSARFTPELVHAVDDTLRLVFRERLPTLRTIAVEDQLLIDPDLGDNGFMLGQTQTLTICTQPLQDAPPVVLLGLMIHEVGHAWQLAQDFDESNLAAENTKMYFPPGRFTRSLERFDWQVDKATIREGYRHRLYWPHFYATSPRYTYRGTPPRGWATWFENLQRESGPEFLRNSPAVTWGMIGPYSLTSPWEWHADHLMAALYNRIDRGIGEHPNRAYRSIAGLLRGAMLDAVQDQWSRFDYRNAIGTPIDRELGRRFALTKQELEILVDRYVIPLADFPMLSEALAFESSFVSEPSPSRSLSASFGAAWHTMREQLHEPLRQRPDIHALIHLGLEPWRELAAEPASASERDDELDTDDDGRDDEGELDTTGDPTDSQASGSGVDRGRTEPSAPASAGDELDEVVDGETLAWDERPARSGRPRHRGGAGRVGGVFREPDDPPRIAETTVDAEPGDAGDVIDPVVSLFEQLRRTIPEPEPEPEPDEPSAEDPPPRSPAPE
jgi:hypothetical protein